VTNVVVARADCFADFSHLLQVQVVEGSFKPLLELLVNTSPLSLLLLLLLFLLSKISTLSREFC
jgi:hypothetical protein